MFLNYALNAVERVNFRFLIGKWAPAVFSIFSCCSFMRNTLYCIYATVIKWANGYGWMDGRMNESQRIAKNEKKFIFQNRKSRKYFCWENFFSRGFFLLSPAKKVTQRYKEEGSLFVLVGFIRKISILIEPHMDQVGEERGATFLAISLCNLSRAG